ncbi:hypothetical protein HY29_09535 [Hyphomonas beringensis]|uniref:DUF3299 domain-containing protein n=1 Tax=Hyphomonas beringensis TaxID=1280946 RepID=A0A062UEZ4_9PROT|nr:DUF3299 domain-containing protein [Hyphomonas beringensis]KCZ56283.1 hypothetical protein HY29_09535 [Hyphomonas beringensis]
MKQISSLLSAAAVAALITACGQSTTAPEASAETPAPEASKAETSKSDGPQVGDKIGQSDAERQAAKEASIAAKAAEQARKQEEIKARGVTEIGWEDLMPEGEEERLAKMYQSQMAMLYGGGGIAEGSAADTMVQIGTFNTVKALDGKKVRIPGYTVPFEYGSKAQITQFLLVPYFGACIHSPPPPPNQTVFVSTEDPIQLKDLAQAVWVEGILHAQTQESDLADAAYTLEMTHIEKYEY